LLVSDRSGRGRARLGGVVGARGDLQARLTQDLADRLDPEPVSVLVDVVDEHRGGHPGYFSLRSSSAAQKSRRGLQDLVRPPQLADLTLEVGDLLRVRSRGAWRFAGVDLGLPHPS